MSFQFSLQKVSDMKEREKNKKQRDYTEAAQIFEEHAEKLLQLLRAKEEVERCAQKQMISGVTGQELQIAQSQLLNLDQHINKQQQKASVARDQMLLKESLLKKASVDHLKYEKMKEKKHLAFLQQEKKSEMKRMDDLSVQRYYQTILQL